MPIMPTMGVSKKTRLDAAYPFLVVVEVIFLLTLPTSCISKKKTLHVAEIIVEIDSW